MCDDTPIVLPSWTVHAQGKCHCLVLFSHNPVLLRLWEIFYDGQFLSLIRNISRPSVRWSKSSCFMATTYLIHEKFSWFNRIFVWKCVCSMAIYYFFQLFDFWKKHYGHRNTLTAFSKCRLKSVSITHISTILFFIILSGVGPIKTFFYL